MDPSGTSWGRLAVSIILHNRILISASPTKSFSISCCALSRMGNNLCVPLLSQLQYSYMNKGRGVILGYGSFARSISWRWGSLAVWEKHCFYTQLDGLPNRCVLQFSLISLAASLVSACNGFYSLHVIAETYINYVARKSFSHAAQK